MLQIFVIVFPGLCCHFQLPQQAIGMPQCLRLDWEKPELPKMLMGRLKSLLEGQTDPKNPTCTAADVTWSVITVVLVVTRQL